jgi:hypothetical protein
MTKAIKAKMRKKKFTRFDGMTIEQMIALVRAKPEPTGRAKTWEVVWRETR